MKGWITRLAGALLVIVFAASAGGLLLLARAQQSGVGAAMAAAGIRSVTPPDGAIDVPPSGDIRADYVTRPGQDPAIKVEPPVGVTLSNGHWEGTVFVIHYEGLRDGSQYHAELDQDQAGQKGEHKQTKIRWSFRTGTRATTSASARVNPTPTLTPSTVPTPVPGTRPSPLIWYGGAHNLIYAVDWTGKQIRDLQGAKAVQAPDGSRLWYEFPQSPPAQPPGTVTNAVGVTIGNVPGYQQMMWADDGAQFCAVTASPAAAYELDLIGLNGDRRAVASISLPSTPVQSPALAACSDSAHRALVVGQGSGYTWSLSLISLTDGSVIYQRRYPNPLARLVASHDGHIIAEQLAGNAMSAPYTLIREIPGGQQLAQLQGIVVDGFSWDGTLVAGGTRGNASVLEAQVIRWQTQQVIWRTCTCPNPSSVHVLAEPDGARLAIIAGWNQGLNASFTIVDASGRGTTVPLGQTPVTPAF